jgi:hypothetical protein
MARSLFLASTFVLAFPIVCYAQDAAAGQIPRLNIAARFALAERLAGVVASPPVIAGPRPSVSL